MEGELAGSSTDRTRPLHPAPEGPFKQLDRVANVAIVFLIANVVLDAFAVFTDIQFVGFLDRVKAGEMVTAEEAESLDLRMLRVAIMQGLAVLIAGIPFIMWFRRAYRNLGALGIRRLRIKPGWAVGAWFVPVLNAIRPKSIANDIWRATAPDLPRETEEPPPGGRVSSLLNWWWAAFIVSGFLYSSGNRVAGRPSIEELLSEVKRYVFADALSVIAGVLAILVVRAMTERMQRRWAEREQNAPVSEGANVILGDR